MQNGEYADPFNYSSWTETVIISNDCQGNITVNQANVIDTDNRVYGFSETTDWPSFSSATDNGMIQVIDSVLIPSSFNFTPPNNDEPRFNPRFDIPSNLENDGEFGDLMDALGMTMLMDDINVENSPQMGMTIFAPTDEAFAAAGIDLDDYDSLQKLEGLSEIILNHISFDWVLSLPDECIPAEFDMETTDSFPITITNDCEGDIFVNEAKILYSQEVENGVIYVIDKILMPNRRRTCRGASRRTCRGASGRTCRGASGRTCRGASGRTCRGASGRTCRGACGRTCRYNHRISRRRYTFTG
jgi:uncharacterized surface protein with fasciclin (FAS1) repeats